MRVSLFILGVFVAVVCIEKPAEAEQKTTLGASINLTNPRSVGTQHSNNAWLTGLGKARLVHLVRTRRHQNHRHQAGPRGAKWLKTCAKAPVAWQY